MARILVLEDDLDFGLRLADTLILAGHAVELSTSPSEVFDEVAADGIDLVITDIFFRKDNKLEKTGGLSVINKFRNIGKEQRRHIPVIAISDPIQRHGKRYALQAAYQVGADAALDRPSVPCALLPTVDKLVAQFQR